MTDLQTPESLQKVVVYKREMVTPEVVMLELRSEDGSDLPSWEPGAHIDLMLPGDMVRQYSLSGDVNDRKSWRIAVFREPAGRGGSEYVHDVVMEGAVIETRGPRNHFTFTPKQKTIFIAGGIGITPLMPMASAVVASGATFELHYGGRSATTMAFADELTQLHGDHVNLVPQDEKGFMDLKGLLACPDDDTLIYCCGPAPLLDAVEAAAEHWPAGSVKFERFAPRAIDETAVAKEIEVELTISGLTLTVPADVPIITVLEENDVPVVASCYEGTCGSCESFVLEGIPDHRDSVLSDTERASNNVMMICVSRALTPKLKLEI